MFVVVTHDLPAWCRSTRPATCTMTAATRGSMRCCRCSHRACCSWSSPTTSADVRRLGGRRRLLVLPHRPLLGGEGELVGGNQRRSSPRASATSAFLFGIFALFALGHTFNITELNSPAEEGEIGGTGPDRGRAAAVPRSGRKVGAVPSSRVAARRHGRSHSGLGADSRRDDGRRRDLPGGPHVRTVRACRSGPRRRCDRCVRSPC